MRKPTSLIFGVSAIILTAIYFVSFWPAPGTGSFEEKGEKEEQDGIRQIQEHEFRITRDPALGFVPQYRLIQAGEELLNQRQARTAQLTGLTWFERGSYTDVVGPSNGNGRPGNGVTSGRIRALWVDLSDPTRKTVWAGGVSGGLWKTTDITANPANWTPVNDFMGNLAIASIAQDPSNPNIMYCGTGEKTFNADAVRGGGIWKSTDNGGTWTLLPSTVNFWNVSKVICDNSGNIYVGTIGNASGLLRSSNGGTSWTNITPATAGGGTRISDLEISSTGRLHVTKGYYNSAANQSGYFYTDNPATVTTSTWTAPASSFTAQYNVEIAVAGNTVYALPSNSSFETPTVYKSTDGGASWAATATSPPATSGNNHLSSGQGWFCIALGIDPANANNVIVGGLNCYKTTNGGATWSQVSVWVSGVSGTVTNYVHADQHAVAWNGSQVLIGTDGGVFYSADGGNTYADRNVNLRLKQFYSCAIHPSSTNYFLAGSQDNGVHQFNGAGLTSSVEVTGGDGAFVAIDQDQPTIQFGTYVHNRFRRSTDGGNTWQSINFVKGNATTTDFGSFINPYDYDNTENNIYAGGDEGEFFRWTNPHSLAAGTYKSGGPGFPAGVSIVSITGFGADLVSAVKISPYTSNRVFFGTSEGKIVRVDNAHTVASGSSGTTLTGSSFPTDANISCVNVGTSDNHLIASFSNYGVTNIWVSTNGGSSWTGADGNLPDVPVRWVMFYPGNNNKAIIATDLGVFQTASLNGSSTSWVQESTFPMVRTNMLRYRSSDQTLVAATHGRGLWTANIPTILPVSLSSLTARLEGAGSVIVNWSTSSEQNSKNFEVEKSTDGINYYKIGTVTAAGNSSSKRNYSLRDNQVNAINHYRLKMNDLDGKSKHSHVVIIRNNSVSQTLWVLNNPFRNYIDLRLAVKPQSVRLQLISMNGATVTERMIANPSEQIRWDLHYTSVSKGTYLLRAIVDGKIFTEKLVKD